MKTMLSGIKPSGKSLTLGNYIGAIKQFVKYQDEYKLYVFVADLHALTVYQDPNDLRESINNLVAVYLAAGLDPEKVCLFKQSDIPAHAQLGWILNCNSLMSDLTMMTQYKAKTENIGAREGIYAGLLNYPTLMAADILLYDADYIPVGIDQKQHVELTHTLAERFNKRYGETFKLPEPLIAKTGAKIMSLSDPTKKMSKSESDKGTIYLLDDPEVARKKIMKALTDSENKVYYDPVNKPGISNLLNIFSALTDTSIDDIVKEFEDVKNYGVFKTAVANVVCNFLSTLQAKINQIKNSNIINQVLEKSVPEVSKIANKKLDEVYHKIGIR